VILVSEMPYLSPQSQQCGSLRLRISATFLELQFIVGTSYECVLEEQSKSLYQANGLDQWESYVILGQIGSVTHVIASFADLKGHGIQSLSLVPRKL